VHHKISVLAVWRAIWGILLIHLARFACQAACRVFLQLKGGLVFVILS